MPKIVKGGPFGFFENPLCCKISKFGAIKIFEKKSLTTEKNPSKNTLKDS